MELLKRGDKYAVQYCYIIHIHAVQCEYSYGTLLKSLSAIPYMEKFLEENSTDVQAGMYRVFVHV